MLLLLNKQIIKKKQRERNILKPFFNDLSFLSLRSYV